MAYRILIQIGSCMLIALGLNGFLVPFGLMEGGALGISLIIHYLSGMKVGLMFLVISLPIFLMAWIWHRPFFYNGIHGMLASSLIIDLLAPVRSISDAVSIGPAASAVCGGLLIGLGTGILLRSGISIGGTDLLAQLLANWMRLNTGFVILLFDLCIVTAGSLLIPGISILLSTATVLSVGGMISLIVWGFPENRPAAVRRILQSSDAG
ncbi:MULTISPECIES: YitT family protein [Sporosarcina]|uniref:YitT family protein n=1 Tax=Sporosarcina TaxID=1569 RepID=UPI000694F733|nr:MULTISPECIES: YitT family protein [Sporosarcina]WJY27907.1 YitT family protein [Sporosarcina sp. 0.2-SM1T-5]